MADADIENLVFPVTPGATLRGRIVLDDDATPLPKVAEVRVTALPVEFDSAPVAGGPPPSETREDLTFEVTRLSGMRRVFVTVGSLHWALKKITLNDLDIIDAPVDLRARDVEGVEVILTSRVTRLSGTASNDRGPVTDYAVLLFASDPTKWIDRSRFVMMSRPTQEGRFDIRGLPPEDYYAIALTGVTSTEWQDPEFLQQLRPQATPVTLLDGESKTVELKLKGNPSTR